MDGGWCGSGVVIEIDCCGYVGVDDVYVIVVVNDIEFGG